MSYLDEPLDESPATFLTHHVVVPAAIIAMVSSFLFYLVDVRSAFLGGGPALKWVGFCFVMGTVLIERYSRSSGVEASLQELYTLFLAGATVAVMLISPWAADPAKPGERLANLVIVAVVWRFATRVTRGLSPEIGRAPKLPRDLLSVAPEVWMGTAERKPPPPPPPSTPRNPAATVARLAAVALLAFALGEPVLLAAAPQTGMRALTAVVIFLFSTGIVLAAGSAMETLRQAEGPEGRVSPGLVPSRVAVAVLLMAVVLASALAVPGLNFQGTGRLRPPTADAEGEERDRGYQEAEQAGRISTRPPEEDGGDPSKAVGDSAPLVGGPAAGMLSLLAIAGKWLLIPLVLALVIVGIWSLVRLWPLLKGWRSRAGDRWRALLSRLAGLFSRLSLPSFGGGLGTDPLKDLDNLVNLPNREAVLAAYHRFLALLENLGHARSEKATPYEVLNGLPPDLRYLEGPARTLTDLYVLAAYAAEPVEQGARERAITALKGIRGLLERPAA